MKIMTKLPTDNNNNNDDLCDSLFDEEWHNKVQRTISFTIKKLDESNTDYDHLSVVKKIIDYNIEKTLTEALSSMKFPEALDFSTVNYCEAFEEFHRVLGIFMNGKEKTAELDIYVGNNEVVEDFILSLDSYVMRSDDSISIRYEHKIPQTLHCTFLKVK